MVTFLAILASSVLLIRVIPSEYTPDEDRGSFFTFVRGPEGATYEYMKPYMDEIERRRAGEQPDGNETDDQRLPQYDPEETNHRGHNQKRRHFTECRLKNCFHQTSQPSSNNVLQSKKTIGYSFMKAL